MQKKILESFPHSTIVSIIRQLTYEIIAQVYLKLNANAVSVHSPRGNRQLGLLYLTVYPYVYIILLNVLFNPLLNPEQD